MTNLTESLRALFESQGFTAEDLPGGQLHIREYDLEDQAVSLWVDVDEDRQYFWAHFDAGLGYSFLNEADVRRFVDFINRGSANGRFTIDKDEQAVGYVFTQTMESLPPSEAFLDELFQNAYDEFVGYAKIIRLILDNGWSADRAIAVLDDLIGGQGRC
jgi:hypothetical protein